MRVKIFRNNDDQRMEHKINKWLGDNPDIIIRYVCHTADEKFDTISIFYQSEVNFKPIQK